jgi:hypothetical protein
MDAAAPELICSCRLSMHDYLKQVRARLCPDLFYFSSKPFLNTDFTLNFFKTPYPGLPVTEFLTAPL